MIKYSVVHSTLLSGILLLLLFTQTAAQVCSKYNGTICVECSNGYTLVDGQCQNSTSVAAGSTPKAVFNNSETITQLLGGVIGSTLQLQDKQNNSQLPILNVTPRDNGTTVGNYYQLQAGDPSGGLGELALAVVAKVNTSQNAAQAKDLSNGTQIQPQNDLNLTSVAQTQSQSNSLNLSQIQTAANTELSLNLTSVSLTNTTSNVTNSQNAPGGSLSLSLTPSSEEFLQAINKLLNPNNKTPQTTSLNLTAAVLQATQNASSTAILDNLVKSTKIELANLIVSTRMHSATKIGQYSPTCRRNITVYQQPKTLQNSSLELNNNSFFSKLQQQLKTNLPGYTLADSILMCVDPFLDVGLNALFASNPQLSGLPLWRVYYSLCGLGQNLAFMFVDDTTLPLLKLYQGAVAVDRVNMKGSSIKVSVLDSTDISSTP